MSANRRGFIGIFSNPSDTRSADPESDEACDTPEGLGHMIKESPGSKRESASDESAAPENQSDWEEIFEDSPPTPAPKAPKPGASDAPESSATRTSAKPTATTPSTPAIMTNSKETTHSNLAALSGSDVQAINDAVQTLRDRLSFTREAAAGENGRSLMKLGDTGRDFIERAVHVVNNDADSLPRAFDDERFLADVELMKMLGSVGKDLAELQRRISDTESKVSSAAFRGALVVNGCTRLEHETGSRATPYSQSSANGNGAHASPGAAMAAG